MKNKYDSTKSKVKAVKEQPINYFNSLILILYGYITVLTPNLVTLDSNGPKFLSIAVLNLLVFVYVFFKKEYKEKPELLLASFKSIIGILYFLLMLVALLSFTKSINILESVLHFAKIFTIFTEAYLISLIVAKDKRIIDHLAIALTTLLFIDCIAISHNMYQYINKEITDFLSIKTIYSNKNILASSVFVKIPFALWLFTYNTGWKKKFAAVVLAFSFFSIFFLSARSFYLGTIAVTLLYLGIYSFTYLKTKEKISLNYIITIIAALVLAAGAYTIVQKYFLPKTQIYTQDLGNRLSSIKFTNESSQGRLAAWERSFHLIAKEPILGVGLGNWKVATLKEENSLNPGYIYQYKAHNDFIETTTETGIVGGLLFLGIFIYIFLSFAISIFKGEKDLSYQFLVFFGFVAYFFDAFFNFPQDRPEIQVFFGIYAGLGISIFSFKNGILKSDSIDSTGKNGLLNSISDFLTAKRNSLSIIYKFIIAASVVYCAIILFLNFQSLRLQRIIMEELLRNKLTTSSSLFVNNFPSIPDINVVGEPISVQKARYLINEKKYNEAIQILKKDKSSPFDSRPEFFTAMAYFNQGQHDSALVYNKKVLQLKPYFFDNISMMVNILEQRGKLTEALPLVTSYLNVRKDNQKAWLAKTQLLNNIGEFKQAYACIDTAKMYFPADTTINKQFEIQRTRALISAAPELYNRAIESYQKQDYLNAEKLLSEFIKVEPNLPDVYEYRAFCRYFLRQYQESINDINVLFGFNIKRNNLLNLTGVNYQNLGNRDEACKWYLVAIKAGSKDAETNYARYCKDSK